MTVTIQDVMRQIGNHFVTGRIDGAWQVQGGKLLPESLLRPGEWIAIPDGPIRGVWQLDEHGAIPGATEVEWEGCIFRLEPPAAFLRLCDEISQWAASHPDPAVTAERFGEYSRNQQRCGWEQVFAQALVPFRRMFPEVNV